MSDLRRRAPTALVYGAVVLAALLAPAIVFYALLAVLFALALAELRALIARGAGVAVAAAYVAAGLLALAYLRSLGPQWVLVALVPTWAADVAAYMVGSRWGTARIAPRISPGKTLEGTAGGFAAAMVAGFGISVLTAVQPLAVFVVGLFLGPAALAGDLLESAVKRAAGVKDSGRLFPGHGGVLDRIDSLLLVAPLVALASRLP